MIDLGAKKLEANQALTVSYEVRTTASSGQRAYITNKAEYFVNTNDGTCEGLVYTNVPAFSVQFHPEACSGPLDTSFLFDEFVKLINNHNYFKTFKAEYERVDAIEYFASTIKKTMENA